MSRRVRVANLAGAGLIAGVAACLFAPQALAFPNHRTVGDTEVWSEAPIPPAIGAVLARADRLRRASPIDGPGYGRHLFLTRGGWRWRLLSLRSAGAFAQTRPLTEPIVVNRSDVAADRVFNGQPVAGVRSLSGVIAHERTHGLIRARYGLWRAALFPSWLVEGYCDHVAGGGSLSDAEAVRLERAGERPPALAYYHGRRRVEAVLRANGASVDQLFGAE